MLEVEDRLPEGAGVLPFEGWFVHPGRAGINRTVRAPCRARHSAYGAGA